MFVAESFISVKNVNNSYELTSPGPRPAGDVSWPLKAAASRAGSCARSARRFIWKGDGRDGAELRPTRHEGSIKPAI